MKRMVLTFFSCRKLPVCVSRLGIFLLAAVIFSQPACHSDSDPDTVQPLLLELIGTPAYEVVTAYDREALQAGNLGHGCLEPDIENRIETIIEQMTLKEKIDQMHGDGSLSFLFESMSHTLGLPRLGVPPFHMVDGPRGAKPSPSTTFPVGKARGATWDTALEKRVGEVMGLEALAKGANMLLAPTIEPVRHPRWGRTQETYGEDPLHVGRMGAAFISGVQQHVIASAKHFAANSIENSRFHVNITMDERTLREIYLSPFKIAVQEAAVGSVMSAYNKINGFYCAENHHLLRDILKGEWEFKGFVESDWILGTRSTIGSANAGLDIEMPFPIFYGNLLLWAVKNGKVSELKINEAVARILRQQFCFGLDRETDVDPAVVESPQHVAVALEAARKSIVLLKNKEDILPLDPATIPSLALVGELSDHDNLGDFCSSYVAPTVAVTPLNGLLRIVPSLALIHINSNILDDEQERAVASADTAVVVVGLTGRDEGEFTPAIDPNTGRLSLVGDRTSLRLPVEQEALVLQVAALNPRTIVVLEGGGAFLINSWIDQVAAVLMAWYPGMQGGLALAEILFGDVNPSGKLPVAFPASEAQLPVFSNTVDQIEYGYYHGYRFTDRKGYDPLFPFGFGLSYTTFAYGNLQLSSPAMGPDGNLRITVDVTNTGPRAGDEIIQLYVSYDNSTVERPLKELKAFGRLTLEPDETKRLLMTVMACDLAYFNSLSGAWEVEALSGTIQVGPSSRNLPLSAPFRITENSGK